MPILVLNSGSSSLKYRVLDLARGKTLAGGKIERVRDHADALAQALKAVQEYEIQAVGHRVVHGGEHFHDACKIDDPVLAAIEACVPLAPLHNPANLAGIRAAMRALPEVDHVAVFDTAFHSRMPRRSRTYALDAAVAADLGIRRYGFHGPSHAFVTQQAAAFLRQPVEALRLISLHLGNGASACAVEFGHSLDTSMGMTPLEGLVMGTRSGDLDPGVILHLFQQGYDVEQVDELLNRGSGLLGLDGASGDLRDVEERAARGEDSARLAISVFAHRVRKYIGAYAAALGGVDAVILTGGIGQNSASMRQRILQRLEFFGLLLDEDRNLQAEVSEDAPVYAIHAEAARVKALVVATNEELMIARATAELVRGAHRVGAVEGISIAVSARHAHLDRKTFRALFGEDAKPTKDRDISQPGQYACEEKINLIGPRARIDGVRLLGPLRSRNQIEISRTDEFKLGIDAPVRDSGNVATSAPVTLEGPAGTVHLEEGLICARRHIHMSLEDASRYGVEDKDEVEVAITGGPRDLIFGDVLVRVGSRYVLEMHIDTDEGNAAELGMSASGALVYTPVLQATAGIQSRRVKA